jgi:predicted nuclease of predicted toxin-antitoxin system
VILWLDAQFPPSLAAWLASNYDVSAVGVRDLGLRDAEDREIFDQARAHGGVVIVSKDSDFVDLIERLGTPPQLLWVTCGNLSNKRLQQVFGALLPDALKILAAGEAVVEIGDQ